MEYQATYRSSEIAIPALLGVLVLGGIGVASALQLPDMNVALSLILWMLGASVIAVLLIFAGAFRVHRWAITADGLQIAERPKVPLVGFRRRAEVPFAAIAAVYRVESGLVRVIDIVTREGHRYRLPQDTTGSAAADLDDFIASIREAALAAGIVIPEAAEGLSFWNTLAGIACLLGLFAVALVFAAAVGWALLDGYAPTGSRSGYSTAIALLLPFGAGYLLLKSVRRRRLVLARRGGN